MTAHWFAMIDASCAISKAYHDPFHAHSITYIYAMMQQFDCANEPDHLTMMADRI